MTSGGCSVDWMTSPTAPGVLLTASFPSSNTTWECQAKAHVVFSDARITANVVGIRPKDRTKPLPSVEITSATSVFPVPRPHARAVAAASPVVTGGRALTLAADLSLEILADDLPLDFTDIARPAPWLGTGQLPHGQLPGFLAPGPLGATYRLPDRMARELEGPHIYPSPRRVRAFAVNVKFN